MLNLVSIIARNNLLCDIIHFTSTPSGWKRVTAHEVDSYLTSFSKADERGTPGYTMGQSPTWFCVRRSRLAVRVTCLPGRATPRVVYVRRYIGTVAAWRCDPVGHRTTLPPPRLQTRRTTRARTRMGAIPERLCLWQLDSPSVLLYALSPPRTLVWPPHFILSLSQPSRIPYISLAIFTYRRGIRYIVYRSHNGIFRKGDF